MPKYPELTPGQVMSALRRLGFHIRRQRGSHVVMRRDQPFAQTVVPRHRSVKATVVAEILRQAGVGLDEFLRLVS